MKVEPYESGCFEDGNLTKDMNGFECIKSATGKYSCSFGINLVAGTLRGAEPC